MALCASPQYLAEHGAPRRIDELGGHVAIAFRLPTSGRTRPWQFRQRGAPIEIEPAARVRVNDGEGMIAAACLGLGVCQLPDYNMIADELADRRLVELLLACRPEPLPISVVSLPARVLPARVRVAIEALESLRRSGPPAARPCAVAAGESRRAPTRATL